MSVAFDLGLVALTLAVAAWTVATRETFAAVVGFVACGIALSLAWVRLGAVDVALTEAAIGSGLTGVLLLGAAARLRARDVVETPTRPGPGMRLLAAVLAAAVAAALALSVLVLPDPAPTLAPVAVAALPQVGLGNPVTGVLMAFRAIDTLVEKVVIVVAVVGVWSLAADRDWGGRPEPRFGGTPDGALVLLARTLPPLGIVVAIYLLWTGADSPGGAFPGGTVIAAMWLLTMMAGIVAAPAIGARGVRLALVAGPAAFLAVGLAGVAIAGAFLAYPAAIAKPLIVLVEVPLIFSVAATLGLLLAGPPERPDSR